APAQERDQGPEPVAGRREDDVSDTDRGERAGELAALGGRGHGKALAQPAAAGVDAKLTPGLWIHEVEEAHVRQYLLPRVLNLHGDDVVPAGELQQRRAPVARTAEVGDDDDQRALSSECARVPECGSERARGGPVGSGLAAN